MDDGAVVAICGGGASLCSDECFRAADYYLVGATDVVSDFGCVYDCSERNNGRSDDLGDSECND